MKIKVIIAISIIIISMLVIPLCFFTYLGISNVNIGLGGMLSFFILLNPIIAFILGIIAGTDVKKLWWIPLFTAIIFPPLSWIIIKSVEFALYIYSAIYFAISMVTMLIILAIKSVINYLKNCKNKKEMGKIEKAIQVDNMKWKVINILSVIMIIVSVLMLAYSYFRERYELQLNKENKKIIEEILREEQGWKNIDLNNVEKIRWYFDFNDDQYTFFYDNGTFEEYYDDHIYELKNCIIENGKLVGTEWFWCLTLFIGICICANLKISNNEDKLHFYKKEYNKNILQ